MRVINCVILYFLQYSLYAVYAGELQKVNFFSTLPNKTIEREILHQALVKNRCRQMLKLGFIAQYRSQENTLNLEFPVTFKTLAQTNKHFCRIVNRAEFVKKVLQILYEEFSCNDNNLVLTHDNLCDAFPLTGFKRVQELNYSCLSELGKNNPLEITNIFYRTEYLMFEFTFDYGYKKHIHASLLHGTTSTTKKLIKLGYPSVSLELFTELLFVLYMYPCQKNIALVCKHMGNFSEDQWWHILERYKQLKPDQRKHCISLYIKHFARQTEIPILQKIIKHLLSNKDNNGEYCLGEHLGDCLIKKCARLHHYNFRSCNRDHYFGSQY